MMPRNDHHDFLPCLHTQMRRVHHIHSVLQTNVSTISCKMCNYRSRLLLDTGDRSSMAMQLRCQQRHPPSHFIGDVHGLESQHMARLSSW